LEVFGHRLSAPTESLDQMTGGRRFEPNELPSQERVLARS
jgi:hypothetical protein